MNSSTFRTCSLDSRSRNRYLELLIIQCVCFCLLLTTLDQQRKISSNVLVQVCEKIPFANANGLPRSFNFYTSSIRYQKVVVWLFQLCRYRSLYSLNIVFVQEPLERKLAITHNDRTIAMLPLIILHLSYSTNCHLCTIYSIILHCGARLLDAITSYGSMSITRELLQGDTHSRYCLQYVLTFTAPLVACRFSLIRLNRVLFLVRASVLLIELSVFGVQEDSIQSRRIVAQFSIGNFLALCRSVDTYSHRADCILLCCGLRRKYDFFLIRLTNELLYQKSRNICTFGMRLRQFSHRNNHAGIYSDQLVYEGRFEQCQI